MFGVGLLELLILAFIAGIFLVPIFLVVVFFIYRSNKKGDKKSS